MQESLGIPVVVVDSELSHTPEAYRFMGELFGVEDTAEQLAAYAEATLDDIANMDIPERKRCACTTATARTRWRPRPPAPPMAPSSSW